MGTYIEEIYGGCWLILELDAFDPNLQILGLVISLALNTVDTVLLFWLIFLN